jgi:acyl-coenzyme A thioesterase PaaI-like protein
VPYPPDEHVLRDLRATSWLEAEDHAVAEMPVDVAVLDASGAASLGALATLVDLCCARVAFHAAAGSWIATADLSLHLTQPVPVGGTARVDAWLLKAGSKLISIAVDLHGAGRGMVSFARIPREASEVERPPVVIGERSSMASSGPPLDVNVTERMGLRVTGDGVELDRHDYVRNSFGTINGGVMGLLVTAAAEAATGGVGSDLTLRYHGQTKVGPARATASVLRPDVCEVRVVDTGADDLLLATAYVVTGRAAG